MSSLNFVPTSALSAVQFRREAAPDAAMINSCVNASSIVFTPEVNPSFRIDRDAYRADYTVDVSSPGPERPLRKPAHFAAAVGHRVAVRTESEINGRSRVRGVVKDVAEDAVTIETAEARSLRIPYEAIVRGNLIDEGLKT